jgi:hypothetical protein
LGEFEKNKKLLCRERMAMPVEIVDAIGEALGVVFELSNAVVAPVT